MDKDIELQKTQILADYCESRYNLGVAELIAAYVALIIAWLQYLYQNYPEQPSGLSPWGYILLILGSIILLVMFRIFCIKRFRKQHDSDLGYIQTLLNKIEKGEPIDTLPELKKMVSKHKKKESETLKAETERINQNSQ